MSTLLAVVFPSVLVVRTFNPYSIALWQPVPWSMSAADGHN